MDSGNGRVKLGAVLALVLLGGLGAWALLGPGFLPGPAVPQAAGADSGGGVPPLQGLVPPRKGENGKGADPERSALASSRKGDCRLAGRVFSMKDGSPVAGALVRVFREFPATKGFQDLLGNMFRRGLWVRRVRPLAPLPVGEGRTGPDGRFRIDGLPAGRFWLNLGPGFEYPYRIPGVTLAPGEAREDVEIAVLEGGMVRGRVLDWRGRPVEGAVLDLRPGLNSFLSHFFGTGYHWRSGTTGDDGTFELQGVPPGKEYVLTAFGKGMPIQVKTDLEVEARKVTEVEFRGEEPASVSGVVRDTEGNPLPGARVAVAFLDLHEIFFSPEACPPVEAGRDGTFRIDGLPPGPAAVAARLEGRGLSDPEVVTLEPGGRVEDLVLLVGEGGEVSGKVTDPSGRPLEGALVEAWNGVFQGGLEMSRFLTFGRVRCRSGRDGAFHLAGLSGGRCFLKASKEGYGEKFLPRIGVGSRNVKVVLEPLAGVRGIVVAKGSSKPVRSFSVRLRGVPFFQGAKYKWEFQEETGRFFIPGVPAGEAVLRFEAPGFVPLDKKVRVEPEKGAKGVIVLLDRESTISGRVVDGKGLPVAGARVAAYRGNTPPGIASLRASLPGPGGGSRGGMTLSFGMPGRRGPRRGPPDVNPMSFLMGWSGAGKALSGPDGSFTLRGLPAGKWKVSAFHPDHAPAEAVEVETSPAAPAADVVLRMRDGAVLWGYVRDLSGRPQAHAVVAAFSFRGGFRSDTTDRNGLYRIPHLLAGRWFVFKSRVLGHSTRNIAADLLGNFRLKQVRIPEKGEVRFDITDQVRDGVDVEGRVLRGGEPVPNAVVTALTGQGEGPLGIGIRSTMADKEGRYRLPSLSPGSYVFQVALTRGRPSTIPVEVPQGRSPFHRDLELPTSRIAGKVLGPSGRPVRGARVRAVPRETPGGGGILSLLISRGAWRGRTGPGGDFTLRRVPQGVYDLQVEPPRDRKDLGEASLQGISVDGRTDLEGLQVILPPAGILEGSVRDGRGEPLSGVRIQASREGGREKSRDLAGKIQALKDAGRFRAVTDSSGDFRIEGLPAGKWTVRAEKEGFASDQVGGLELVRGGTIRADLVLRKGGTVKILVVNASGSPLPRSRIRVLDESGREVVRPLTAARFLAGLFSGGKKKDRRGWYVLENVKPGNYTVVIRKPSGGEERRPLVVREGEVTEFRLELK